MNVENLTEILRLHADWLRNKPGGVRANLTGAGLIEGNLYGVNLSWAILRWADLCGANLDGADLSWADLTGADLYKADLAGANLTGADLTGANFREADLTNASLTGANLTTADLSGANLTGADLAGANLDRAILVGAYWCGADPTEAKPATRLDDLLEIWSVIDPAQWENDAGPEGWFAVSNSNGIIAYFGTEADAYRFRLAEINRVLNG
jgi:hypothetical protein